ncbi:serine/threonine-protein kinase [Nocardia sp. IFM 10818]
MRLINGRYELRGLVGRGGMAEVWDAWDRQLRRQVAVKVLDAGILPVGQQDEQIAQKRFQYEAYIAGKMSCGNIVTVHDAGVFVDNGRRSPFLVMEFIHGENLREHLRNRENWSLPGLLRVLNDAFAGLVYAHSKQVVHRDIKPENIMICRDGTAKLTDFGIAIELRENFQRLTREHRALGTEQYAAPEYLRHGQCTHLSDVYSLAVVCREVLECAYAPMPIPGRVKAVLDRALSPAPQLRYPSAEEFRHEFREAVAHAETPAHQPAPSPRPMRPAPAPTVTMTLGDLPIHDPEPPPPPLAYASTKDFYLEPMIGTRQRFLAGLHRNSPWHIAVLLTTAATTGMLLGGLVFLILTWVMVKLAGLW